MASNLVDFFGRNAEPLPEKEVIVSQRFKDADGNPIPWKIKALDAGTVQRIRSDAMDMNVDQRKEVSVRFNSARMNIQKAAASVVYPDLLDAELQKYYGVSTPGALIGAMLTDDELETLLDAVDGLSGNIDAGDLEDEAKN